MTKLRYLSESLNNPTPILINLNTIFSYKKNIYLYSLHRSTTSTSIIALKASTSVGGNSCIIEKTSIFTHFVSKLHYISASKVLYNHVYLSTSYSNREYIHGYCSSCIQYFNNFWFVPFFSLSSPSAQLTIP